MSLAPRSAKSPCIRKSLSALHASPGFNFSATLHSLKISTSDIFRPAAGEMCETDPPGEHANRNFTVGLFLYVERLGYLPLHAMVLLLAFQNSCDIFPPPETDRIAAIQFFAVTPVN